MQINRSGSGADHGLRSIELEPPRLRWDAERHCLAFGCIRVADFYGTSFHDYEVSVPLAEFRAMLDTLGEGTAAEGAEAIASTLAPSLRSLLRLAALCIGPVAGFEQRGNHPALEKILAFLNRDRIRATYGAVGEALGFQLGQAGQAVGQMLGVRRPYACWVVNADSGEPTGYEEHEKHSALRDNPEVIDTGLELLQRMAGIDRRAGASQRDNG
jgi:hypothetical protein